MSTRNLLFLFTSSLLLLFNSCDKSSWIELTLNQNECENAGDVVAVIDNETGFVRNVGAVSDVICIEIPDVHIELPEYNTSITSVYLSPCNLDVNALTINSNIKISGVIYNNDEQGPYTAEYVLNLTYLSNAQMEE